MTWHVWKCRCCEYEMSGNELFDGCLGPNLCPNCYEEYLENLICCLDKEYDRTKMNPFPAELMAKVWIDWEICFVPPSIPEEYKGRWTGAEWAGYRKVPNKRELQPVYVPPPLPRKVLEKFAKLGLLRE